MTNENTIGGTVAMAAPTAAGLKHSLRSATKAAARSSKQELEESAFQDAEEKMMDGEVVEDEEVTSIESVEEEKMEETMFQVALMKSVVETTNSPGGGGSGDIIDDPSKEDGLKHRLRKSRRRSGQDLERLERLQSTSEGGGLAHRVIKEEGHHHPATPLGKKRQRQSAGSSDRKRGAVPPPTLSSSVPNPLSDPLSLTVNIPRTKIKEEASGFPVNVPCPVPSVASVPDGSADPGDSKRKVNFDETMGTRTRGLSIDLDCKYCSLPKKAMQSTFHF